MVSKNEDFPTPMDILSGVTASTTDTTSGTDGGQRVRWGLMGAGRVCHDFVQALKSVPGSEVVGVGASALKKAESFASTHGIKRSYGSYAEVAKDPEVDIIYIGTLHPFHKEHAMLAFDAGKHVLVEKPMACTAKDAEDMVAAARAKGLFCMEGVWTRFFPAVEAARQHIAAGVIGEVVAVHADFGFNSSDSESYPDSPFFNRQLGGGGLLFLGIYPIQVVTMCFGAVMPKRIAAAGVKDGPTGVDLSAGITLEYEGKGIAVLTYNLMGETPEETTIIGTKGRITFHTPAHCPTRMTLYEKNYGRGNVTTKTYDYELPMPPPSVEATGSFNYPNSNGFQYEAAAVQRCILAGVKEAPQYTIDESLVIAKIMDVVRLQLGIEPCGST